MVTQEHAKVACQRLSNAQRDSLMDSLDSDGYAILPDRLPQPMVDRLLGAIDRIAGEKRAQNTSLTGVRLQNCVDSDPAFRDLMMYEPALQLAYDTFGPMFHLNQSNFVSRRRDPAANDDFVTSTPWHCDGPRPGLFPSVDGVMALHYLKFGYFLSDLTHGNGGSLQVVRGSHRRPELDGNKRDFHIEDYADDFVQLDCEVGAIVVFNQAQWHAAPPNESDIERKNVYISYCPTWMRPLDREFPTEADLAGLSAEERWLLGEPRPALRWWLPQGDDASRMARFGRDGSDGPGSFRNYE